MDSDQLPADEHPGDPIAKAMIEAGLQTIRLSATEMPDEFLTRVVAIYHEEWELRHGERWAVIEASA